MGAYQKAIAHFYKLLTTIGIRAALQFLNSISNHRFTAVFRFEGSTLRNLYFVDCENPRIERCPDLPVLQSYCMYVRNTTQPLLINDSLHDTQVQGHPQQNVVRSYCGIPLIDEDGTLLGTICHFDINPIPFSDDEAFLLNDITPFLVRAIHETEWRPDS